MKKTGVILVIGVLVISIISVSLVSAGLIGDVWDKITGRVVEENVSEGVEDEVDDEEVEDGVDDIEPEPPDEPPEEEPDEPEEPPDDKQCNEGDERYYNCPDGTKVPNCKCENNMWVCEIFKDENCLSDGPEPEKCAGEIKITFNKGSYKLGDDVKIIIEVFDSQGNHLPDYAFYAQMYDDRWHTPDLQKTDNQGYFIHTGIAEKPGGGVTEVKFKVYTKEIGSCKSVEDTEEVKFEPGECGIGQCEPEPGCRDKVRMCGGGCPACPEDDDDDDIFYPCSGCELEGKCYPYGYRKDGKYCLDENNVFVNQLGDDRGCENNFECNTNLCINGNCVSSNVWNKFLGWFRKIFGGGGPGPGPEICSGLLIEENIEGYEYNQSLYGVSEETQAPLFLDNCEQVGKIKCCVAQYLENGNSGMALMCPYDDRGDVENLVKCGRKAGDFLGEYKGEKVMKMDKERVMVWTYESYALAVGKMPEKGVPEEVADAYLKKYKSDLEEIELPDIPPPQPPNSVELCLEIEDVEERAGCIIDIAISKSDAEVCEYIDFSIDRRDKCYINVAEHTGDDSLCDNVVDEDLREKCYFWVAGEEGDVSPCEEIGDSSLQAMCYVEIAEKTGDAGYCARMTDNHIADKCYRDVGIQTNNRALCGKIIEDKAKQKCMDNTS